MSPSAIPAPCAGKTVVVTGAAKGLGQAAAVAFAAAGAERIAIVDSSSTPDTLERASQATAEAGRPAPELFSLQLEVGDAASVHTGVTEIHSRWGHADILINTIGHMSPFELQQQSLGASDIDVWWKTREVSVKDAFVVARAMLPLLLKGAEKTIVNVISPSSSLLESTSGAHSLLELAMMRLSVGLMLDYGNEGLLAYSLQPGYYEAKDMQESVNLTWPVDQLELASEALVYLASERREWLGGRHIDCGKDMREVIPRNDWDAHNDVLKLSTSVNKIPVASGKRRGRVPRSSY